MTSNASNDSTNKNETNQLSGSSQASQRQAFDELAEQDDIGLVKEFFYFLRDNKKWWLTPLIASLLLIGLVSLMAASGAAPFIYTLF